MKIYILIKYTDTHTFSYLRDKKGKLMKKKKNIINAFCRKDLSIKNNVEEVNEKINIRFTIVK